MRVWTAIGATVVTALFGVVIAPSALQTPAVRSVDEKVLHEYMYRWEPNAFVYLQMSNEFSGLTKPSQLVAFDESGEVRTLYPTDRDQFFAGPGAAVPASIESRIEFQRDGTGKITALMWRREGAVPRTARRVEIENRDGSGAENREYILPFARFLIRRGIAVLGYDKRGVGGSTGDWNTASFDDLAGDVAAAFEYLKTHSDIDPAQIGLLGVRRDGSCRSRPSVRRTLRS